MKSVSSLVLSCIVVLLFAYGGLPLGQVAGALGMLLLMTACLGLLVGATRLTERTIGPAIGLLLLAGAWPHVVEMVQGSGGMENSTGCGAGSVLGLFLLLLVLSGLLWAFVRVRALVPPARKGPRPSVRRRARLTEPDRVNEPPGSFPLPGAAPTDELHLLNGERDDERQR